MSDVEKNNVIEEVFEVEQEKKGFFRNAKDAIKGKIENFSDDHPRLAKAGRIVGKVIVGAGLITVGLVVGNAIANGGDYPGYDDSFDSDEATNEE